MVCGAMSVGQEVAVSVESLCRPMGAELLAVIPLSSGIKAEVKSSHAQWIKFQKNAESRARVRLLSDSDKAKHEEAGWWDNMC